MSITATTATSLARNARRLDRRNRGMIGTLEEMRQGAALRTCFVRGKRVWSLSTGGEVAPEVAALVVAHPDVCGGGDALFDCGLSQTFRYVKN